MIINIKDFGFGVTLTAEIDSNHVIFLIKMSAKDNRFNPDFCTALKSALSTIVVEEIPKNATKKFALIITGSGKFFSNGLDLAFLMKSPNPNQFLIDHYEPLLHDVLTIGIPTIAAVNGHAFAGGMCLALAQDYRLASSSSKALLSMNELLIHAVIPAGMLSVLRAKLSGPKVLRDCVYARRWTITDAHKDGIIDEIFDSEGQEDFLQQSISFAKTKAIGINYIPVLQAIKAETYREASGLLLNPKSDKLDPFRFALPRQSKL